MKGFKVIPPRVVRNSVLVTHLPGLGERDEVALMVWGGAFFQCVFSASCVSASKFENCRFGTQIFISKLFLALKFKPIKSVFLATWKRVDPSL